MASEAAGGEGPIYYKRSGNRFYPVERLYDPATKVERQLYRRDLPALSEEEYAAWVQQRNEDVAAHRVAYAQAQKDLQLAGPADAELAQKRERLAAAMLAQAERRDAVARAKSGLDAARAEVAAATAAAREARRALLEAQLRERQLLQADQMATRQAARQARYDVDWPEVKDWRNWLGFTTALRTTEAYSESLLSLAQAFAGRPAASITRDDLLAFMGDRRLKGYSPSTLGGYVAAFRSFFGFLKLADNPAKGLPFPKAAHQKQRALSKAELDQVAATFDLATAIGIRDMALLSLMAGTGLRASEICAVELAKVNFATRRLSVVCKGGEEEVAAFIEETAGHLQRWLKIRPLWAHPETTNLFVSVLSGRRPKVRAGVATALVPANKNGRPLTRAGLNVICRRWAREAGLVALSPHDLRRTFAVLAIRAGAPTRVVQVAGRWKHIEMVERYTDQHIQPEDLNPFSPAARLRSEPAPATMVAAISAD